MSHYGPPAGGPYQPYPEDPRSGGYESPSDPWGQPAESWGPGPDRWGDQGYPPPGYPESGYPDPGYPDPRYPERGYPPPGYDQPPPGYGRPPPGYGGPPPGYEGPPGYDRPPPGYGGPPPGYEGPPGYDRPPPGYEGPPPGYEGPPPGYDGPPPPRYDDRGDDREPPYRETLAHEPFWDEGRPRVRLGLYATVAVLVVLAAAGVGYALYVLSAGGGEPAAVETQPTQEASAPPATPDASGTPGDNQGLNAAMAQVDDCLVNDGNADETQMRIVLCDDEDQDVVYRVLNVFNETVEGEDDATRHESAQSLCAEIEGYTHHYFEVSDDPTASFVLCMAEEEP